MIRRLLKLTFLTVTLLIIASCSSTKRFAEINEIDESNKGYGDKNLTEVEVGVASFYANEFNGKKTASGEIYRMHDLTAAHPSYPFNTIVRVINLSNNKSVEVRINDRMPNFKGRLIDLSFAAAKKIGIINSGIQKVKIVVLKWGNK